MSGTKEKSGKNSPGENIETVLVSTGRNADGFHGFVNPPVYHGSTVLFGSAESYRSGKQLYRYGRRGTPTMTALENTVSALEGADETKIFPSGLAAISFVLTAFTKAQAHILVSDSVYMPARRYCDHVLTKFGIDITYFDPMIGADIAGLIRPETSLIYLETPGSQSFEVGDIPAIADVARKAGVTTAFDNTWATPLFFRPLEKGVDISISAGTKYFGGHSDIMLGTVSATQELSGKLKRDFETFGNCAGPDDMFLALRGIRTLDVRLRRHMEQGIDIARWLADRPEVETVLHPALPGAAGHDIWKRDFDGASGLFAVVFKPMPQAAADAFIDGLEHFGIGASWGGYESLAIPINPAANRTAGSWPHEGPAIRLHIGLENTDDLKRDLEQGFARLNDARQP